MAPSGWTSRGARRRVYGISADGHGPAVPYGPGSRIMLERHGAPLPVPAYEKGDWLDWFCSLLRITPGRREEFTAHLCHMFCTHQRTPAMVFEDGDGGGPCGKTTAAGLVREVVDPVGFGRSVMMAPSRVRDILEALKSPVLALDRAGSQSRGKPPGTSRPPARGWCCPGAGRPGTRA